MDAGAQSFDLVFSTASALRHKHPPEKSDWTFSLIEVSTRPTEALTLLDVAGFGSLITVEGALLNEPTEEWYVPIRGVRALAANRTKVTVVASVWDLRRSGWVGAELEVRIHYDDGVRAYDALSLNAGGPLLTHFTYDDQRTETGYEGESRTERIADETEVKSFVSVVRALTD